MEKNKYYTPEIEEFHVGFEYEVFQKGTPYDPSILTTFPVNEEDTWNKYTFPDPFFGYRVDILLQKQTVRTKYLDREDIESLGWRYKSKATDIWFEKEGSFDMFGWTTYKATLHYGLHDKKLTIFVLDGIEEHILYRGRCNNKSELRRILNQLNIT